MWCAPGAQGEFSEPCRPRSAIYKGCRRCRMLKKVFFQKGGGAPTMAPVLFWGSQGGQNRSPREKYSYFTYFHYYSTDFLKIMNFEKLIFPKISYFFTLAPREFLITPGALEPRSRSCCWLIWHGFILKSSNKYNFVGTTSARMTCKRVLIILRQVVCDVCLWRFSSRRRFRFINALFVERHENSRALHSRKIKCLI